MGGTHDEPAEGVEMRTKAGRAKTVARVGIAALGVAGALLLLGRSEARRAEVRGAPVVRSAASAGATSARVAAGGPPRAGVDALAADGRRAAASPFDLGAIVEQVHYAFRRQDGAWRGGHATYEVALHPDGALEVKPYHFANGRPVGAPAPAARKAPPEPPSAGAVLEGASVTFGPSRVERGGSVLAAGAGDVSTNARGELERAHGDVTEQLRNGPDGVEQSWRFAARPDGEGDLEVRIAVAGGAFTGETEKGLHFGAGALGLRYGRATWIDALGVETAVPARWDGGAVVLRVPASAVDGSVFPAVLDPVVSPELAMDTPVYGPAWSDQSFAAVASDGAGWLVVWTDYRGSGPDIYGARVSGAGEVLDPAGIAISTTSKNEYYPAVAWDGTEYLVAWGDGTLRGARVSAAGQVLDPGGFAISAAAYGQSNPAIAWSGSQFLVAWYDGRNGTNDIFCARVTGAAEVLDPGGIAVSTAPAAQVYPAVSWDGTDWLVVWYDYRTSANAADVYGARVRGSDGTVLDPAGIAISAGPGYQTDPAVAWDGTNHLVVWRDTRNSGTYDDIYGARVSSAGTVLDPTGFAISTAANNQYDPAVAWDGTNHLVVWVDARNSGQAHVYGARVTSAGAVLDPSGIFISPASSMPFRPAVATNGTDFLVAWEDYRNGSYKDLYGVRVSGAGAVLDASDIAIGAAANTQRGPAVASDGTDYLVVWEDVRSGGYPDIYGVRLRGADGAALDPAGIAISTAAKYQENPAVDWDGTDYLVVWQDERSSSSADIYGARVSPAGAVLDPAGIAISTSSNDQGYPAVAWDGVHHLVVWQEARGAPTYADILGTRVSDAGVVLDSPAIVASASAYDQNRPALAWNGTSYLVVWQDARAPFPDLYGARVSAAGAVVGSEIAVSTAAGSQMLPAVASDGTNHLVVWEDGRSGSGYDVYAARVGPDGTVIDAAGIAVSQATGDQAVPAVAWDGTTYLVGWEDRRSGTSLDVYAAQVTAAGAVLDPDGFLVSGAPSDERSPAIASSGARQFLVAYSAFDTSPATNAWRVRARTVSVGGAPVAFAQSVTTPEDVPCAITLTASGAGTLSYAVVTPPAHGALSGSGADRTYTPDANYDGPDGFTFRTNDGTSDSNVATVTITVTPVNDAPVAAPQSLTLAENGSLPITLAATDVDGDALTYAVVTGPAHGSLTGTGASLSYAPVAGYSGPDAFTFKANDGTVDSAPATVAITVTPAGEPAKGGCGCGTGRDVASPLAVLLLALTWRGRARRLG